MKGRVKMYKEDKGYGFIISDEGDDIFFHVSNFHSSDVPQQGDSVLFDIVKNERGFSAVNIKVDKRMKGAKFVNLGEHRIRVSNIKSYGIGKVECTYEKVFEFIPMDGVLGILGAGDWVETSELRLVSREFVWGIQPYRCLKRDGKYYHDNVLKEPFIKKNVAYLYVQTYQNDEIEFYEDNAPFDIFKKQKEIDSIMS